MNQSVNQSFARANRNAHIATRIMGVVALVFLLLTLIGIASGCQNVGEQKHTFDRGGATIEKPSPVTLDIQDNDKSWWPFGRH